MSQPIFSYDPLCRPQKWILCVTNDQIGFAAIDPEQKKIRQLEYRPFDLYNRDLFNKLTDEWLSSLGPVKSMHVGFLHTDWCWTPTALTQQSDSARAWIEPFWPERIGHTWMADSSGHSDASAWVRVPLYLLERLKNISTDLTFAHASYSLARPSSLACQLSIVRIGATCFFSFRKDGRFLYGQPHQIDTADDLHFVLSLLVDKYSIQPDQVEINLSGQWPIGCDWMLFLQKHFSMIQGRDLRWEGLDSEFPPHWFTPIEDILTCA